MSQTSQARLIRSSLALGALLALLSTSALAVSVSPRMNVQGFVASSSGAPAEGTYTLRLSLHTAKTGGSELYATTLTNIPVVKGLFDVTIGPLPTSVLNGYASVWLETKVGTEAPLPRTELLTTGYALQAEHANTADTAASATMASGLSCSGCVTASHAGFNYAGSSAPGGAATALSCTNCVSTGMLQAGAVTSGVIADGTIQAADVGFNYAGSSSKGGAATSAAALTCTGCVTGTHVANESLTGADVQDGTILAADVGFNYAGSSSKGGPASSAAGLTCTGCVTGGHLADGTVTSADIADGTVAAADVGFNYAGSTSKGGAATGLACTNCISTGMIQAGAVGSAAIADGSVAAADVGFNYAGSSSKGGPASSAAALSCSGCISGAHVADGSLSGADIQDGTVAAADVNFNYAAGTSKGGAATNLVCSGCVGSSDLDPNLSFSSNNVADLTVTGNAYLFGGNGGYQCILSGSCPPGWANRGMSGVLLNMGNGNCSVIGFAQGAPFNSGWWWCHPYLCCR